jgi:hypothetical protein
MKICEAERTIAGLKNSDDERKLIPKYESEIMVLRERIQSLKEQMIRSSLSQS